jgi:glycine cleavage system transcriptional repressor
MSQFFLLTAFGKDRPGIVAQVTGVVFHEGGNIADASMTRLGDEFSMMLVAGFKTPAAGTRFLKSIPAVQKALRLELGVKPISAALAQASRPHPATHIISIYGADRPGIVYRAAHALAAQRVNITDLNTKILRRSGKPLYVMMLEVRFPTASRAAALERTLKRLGKSMRLDVNVQELDTVAL